MKKVDISHSGSIPWVGVKRDDDAMPFMQMKLCSEPDLETVVAKKLKKYNDITGFDVRFSVLYEEDKETVVQFYGDNLKYENLHLVLSDRLGYTSREYRLMYGLEDVKIDLLECREKYTEVCPRCNVSVRHNSVLLKDDGTVDVVGYDCGCGSLMIKSWSSFLRSIEFGVDSMNRYHKGMKGPSDIVEVPPDFEEKISRVMYFVDTVKTKNIDIMRNIDRFDGWDGIHPKYEELVEEIRRRATRNIAAYNITGLVDDGVILIGGWGRDIEDAYYNYIGSVYYDSFVAGTTNVENEWFGEVGKCYEREVIVKSYILLRGGYYNGDCYLAFFEDIETGCEFISSIPYDTKFVVEMDAIGKVIGKKIRIWFVVKDHTYDKRDSNRKLTKIGRVRFVGRK